MEETIQGFSEFFAGYALRDVPADAMMTAEQIRSSFMNTADKVPGDVLDKFFEHADLQAGGKFDFEAVAGQYLQSAE